MIQAIEWSDFHGIKHFAFNDKLECFLKGNEKQKVNIYLKGDIFKDTFHQFVFDTSQRSKVNV
jgi:hypothetical protein